MAKDKKSFLLYTDQIHLFETLSDEEAGRLIKHIFRYTNDLNPELPDRITQIGFEPIKHQLKRDLVKYIDKVGKNSDAGKASAEAKRLKKLNETKQTLTDVEIIQQSSTKSTDIDNDIDNVIVIDKDYDYYIINGKIEKGNIVDWYLKNQRTIFEAELMKLSLSSKANQIIQSFRDRFLNGSSFNDYKHVTNSFRRHITEIEKKINPPKHLSFDFLRVCEHLGQVVTTSPDDLPNGICIPNSV